MDNLLYKTAVKWALVGIGIQLILSLPYFLSPKPMPGGFEMLNILLAIFGFIINIGIYVAACLDFSKKRNHLNSTGEIFSMAGLIFLILTISSLTFTYVFQKYFFELPEDGFIPKENYAEYYDKMFITTLITSFIYGLIVAIAGLAIAGMWRTFQKAGKEGWASIVPVYNYMVMSEIGKNPSWWGILMLIPLANIIFAILILNGVSKAFGKDGGWTVGLLFLGFIFWPLLAWGDAKYQYGDFEESPIGPDVTDHLVD